MVQKVDVWVWFGQVFRGFRLVDWKLHTIYKCLGSFSRAYMCMLRYSGPSQLLQDGELGKMVLPLPLYELIAAGGRGMLSQGFCAWSLLYSTI